MFWLSEHVAVCPEDYSRSVERKTELEDGWRRSSELIIGEIRKGQWWEFYSRLIMKAYIHVTHVWFFVFIVCYVVSERQFWYDFTIALNENKKQIMLPASEFGELTYDDKGEPANWCLMNGRLQKLMFLSVQRNRHKWKAKIAWTHFIFPYVPLVLIAS